MNMAKRNVASGIVVLGITGWYAWMSSQLPSRDIMPDTPGPSFFPWLIVALTGLLSAALVVKGFRELASEAPLGGQRGSRKPAIMLAGFLTYLLCLKVLGFLLASFCFFAFMMWMFGERRPTPLLIASLAVPAALYLIFAKGFQVLLPVGGLGF